MKNINPKILIIDDDIGMIETMSDILTGLGYQVAVASNGLEGINIAGKTQFDVALVDIKMPGINGVDTFKRFKQISPSTRVIMMTAYTVNELIEEAYEEGPFDIIPKPLDIDNLVTLIQHAVKGCLVLIVDDDPDACESLQDVLNYRGYHTGVAYSGKDAIELVKENKYSIVFLDIKMPVLNGLETYLKIKEIDPDTVCVMQTGYKQESAELVNKGIDNSVYTCLFKPLDLDAITTLVANIVRQKMNDQLVKPDLAQPLPRGGL